MVLRCRARAGWRAVGWVVLLVAAGCSGSGGSTGSPSSTAAKPPVTTTTGPLRRSGQQRLSPLYAQGVARIPRGWIFSGTNSLWKTDEKTREIMHTGPSIPDALKAKGFDHIGDIDVVGQNIYAPLEQPDYSKGHQMTALFDVNSLRYLDAVTVPQHENSFVTIDPATMTAYSMDHFNGDELTRYDVAHGWKVLPPLKLSRMLHHTQGADVYGDAIWISTDDAQQGIYRVDRQTGATTLVARMRHPGGEGEGIDASDRPGGFLHVLCVDRKLVPVWFEHFKA